MERRCCAAVLLLGLLTTASALAQGTSRPPTRTALDQYDKEYEVQWYEGMGHSFAQIAPDASVPREQRDASDLSHERTYDFLWRELTRPEPASPPPPAEEPSE